MGKKLKDWMPVQSDRISTNKSAIRYIKEEEENADPAENSRISHALSNTGKKVLRTTTA